MTPRLLILDLDGTALDDSGRISDADASAARALLARGVGVTIATGRLFTGSSAAAERLGVTGSIAVMNGSQHVDVQTERVTFARTIGGAARTHIGGAFSRHGVAPFLYTTRRIHCDRRDVQHRDYLAIWSPNVDDHEDLLASALWTEAPDAVAICAMGTADAIDGAWAELEPQIGDEIGAERFTTFSGERFLKLRSAGMHKGLAVERLAAERGCTPAETVAVGDWTNDLPMLRAAGRSFAMGHAGPEVHAAASDVLDASPGGAVAEVARRVWGL